MATLLDVKERIASEMERDDLRPGGESEERLTGHIERACEYFASEQFWFNSRVTTATTSPGVSTIDVPETIRIVKRLTIPSLTREIREIQLEDILESTAPGIPGTYAYYNDKLRLYPVPDQAYEMNVYGIRRFDALTADSDENVWTNEAQDLIVARVKMVLYRGVFRDPEGAQLALAEVQEALAQLKRETARRLVTPLRTMNHSRLYSIASDC